MGFDRFLRVNALNLPQHICHPLKVSLVASHPHKVHLQTQCSQSDSTCQPSTHSGAGCQPPNTKYTYKHNALNLTQHVSHPLKNGAGCQPPTQSTPTNTTLIYNISSHSVAFSISLMQNFLLITCDIQCSAHLAAFE